MWGRCKVVYKRDRTMRQKEDFHFFNTSTCWFLPFLSIFIGFFFKSCYNHWYFGTACIPTMAGKVPGNVVRQRQFRILALPLARIPRTHPSHSAQPSPTPNTSTSASASQSPPHGSAPSSSSPPSSQPKTPILLFHVSQPDPSSNKGPPSLSKRALTKASDMWLKLGEKDKTTWTYWFYKKGESLMDRIEYEEWALKAITEGQGVKIVKDGESAVQEKIEVSRW